MTLHALSATAAPPPSEPPDAWEYSLQLPHDARAPGIARATVRIVLHEHELIPLIDNAELLCSELVTNAFSYSEGDISVRMRWNGENLRLSVWDTNAQPPTPGTAELDETHGRGLFLVRRLAGRWGIYDFTKRGGGKAVWIELHP